MSIKVITEEELRENNYQLITEFREVVKEELKNAPIIQKWCRTKKLKELTSWSGSTIQTYRVNGILKYSKVGGTIFYDLIHLMNVLETNSKNNNHEDIT